MADTGKKRYKALRILDARKGKNFCVVRVDDAKDQRSPYNRDFDPYIPLMIANCSSDEARQYVRELNSERRTVEDIRARRQYITNMMYSGMN